ncbi:MAG: nucleotide exchange factor GrpE [Flavobacteriaceae bacterium]|nr:nucleotide exchange factor GrpE [Flavobacteriaceae bacterium]
MSTEDIQKEEIKDQVEDQNTETTEVDEQKEDVVELSVEEQLTADLASEKDKFLRLFAEFENYKKRTSKERIELFKTANANVMQAMLPVLDDLDRAWIEIEKSKDDNLIKGIELISTKLRATLKEKGLEVLDVRKGDVFNADFHEAITQIPAPSDDLKGKIIDVIENGYKLGEKIIRFPKVVIGQ